jgi:type IV pilus assembly protein PilB
MALPRVSMVQFLLQKGFLKPEQLEEAQKVAKQTNQTDISKVLLSMKIVGEREILQAKAQEAGMAFADLDRVQIDSSAINIVPERIVKAHSAIPVKKDGQTLWVAMSKVGDIMAIDDIKMASGCRVIPVVAVPAAIDAAIK